MYYVPSFRLEALWLLVRDQAAGHGFNGCEAVQ